MHLSRRSWCGGREKEYHRVRSKFTKCCINDRSQHVHCEKTSRSNDCGTTIVPPYNTVLTMLVLEQELARLCSFSLLLFSKERGVYYCILNESCSFLAVVVFVVQEVLTI